MLPSGASEWCFRRWFSRQEWCFRVVLPTLFDWYMVLPASGASGEWCFRVVLPNGAFDWRFRL
ncbi:hypothetical protein BJ508DRAFT_415583 [Ascobolus immersus RN42]|uniref:Uncharacterized protein n=1 Tax=Ascobolus immersus RN42 TaxID=1160509 RepID=A0A3N4I1W5_ASCIM|nr:hypothetical protein BJ508DRAFT_415583 [Ascobolus immersus RN42]